MTSVPDAGATDALGEGVTGCVGVGVGEEDALGDGDALGDSEGLGEGLGDT